MTDFKEEALRMLDGMRDKVKAADVITECRLSGIPERTPTRVRAIPWSDPQVSGMTGTMTETEYETIGETIELRIHIRYPQKEDAAHEQR